MWRLYHSGMCPPRLYTLQLKSKWWTIQAEHKPPSCFFVSWNGAWNVSNTLYTLVPWYKVNIFWELIKPAAVCLKLRPVADYPDKSKWHFFTIWCWCRDAHFYPNPFWSSFHFSFFFLVGFVTWCNRNMLSNKRLGNLLSLTKKDWQ